jgi:hypothetical protein
LNLRFYRPGIYVVPFIVPQKQITVLLFACTSEKKDQWMNGGIMDEKRKGEVGRFVGGKEGKRLPMAE